MMRFASKRGAQRRPGPEPRRHASSRRCSRPTTRALNEGRGRNPGDTIGPGESDQKAYGAQRRPGPEPRRHASLAHGVGHTDGAQRRPGPEPRRHNRPSLTSAALASRSTKAGAGTPATHPVCVRLPARDQFRSTKAGAGTPATRARRDGRGRGAGPLNEGRGRNPGDTCRKLSGLFAPRLRSTKAGAGTPATHGGGQSSFAIGKCAQRRPGPEPRRHDRTRADRRARPVALNEGRGRNPGDTSRSRCTDGRCRHPLNEGRGRNPGDTVASRYHGRRDADRSTKAGAGTPATPGHQADLADRVGLRSTKAGAGTPATLLIRTSGEHTVGADAKLTF